MKNSLILMSAIFVLGFLAGQAINQNILPLHKMALYENLSRKLIAKYTVSERELSQGRHVAAVYAYGTRRDVIEWYYEMKWKYEGKQ